MTRWLIEVAIDDRWDPAMMNRNLSTIAVYHQFADADRVYRDALKCAPNYRLIETDETDAELQSRRY